MPSPDILALDSPILNPAQGAFMQSEALYTLLSMGYGGGKSFVLGEKGVLRCIQNQQMAGMVIASDYGRLSRDFLPNFFERLEAHEITHEWVKPEIPGLQSRALLIGRDELDVTLYVGSADVPDSLKGPNLAFILLEEATLLPRLIPGKSETVWSLLTSRLRLKGGTLTVDASGTPEGRANWTCDEGRFERSPSDVDKIEKWRNDFRVVRGSTWDNRDNLADGYVENMIASMDPDQVQEKVYGVPTAGVGGVAYKFFDVAKNVRKVDYDPMRGPVCIGLDYNVSPMCSVFMQMWRGHIFVFDEIRQMHSDTQTMCFAMRDKLKTLGLKPSDARIFPDSTGKARKTVGGSDFGIMRSIGFHRIIYEERGNPPVKDRLNAANAGFFHSKIVIDPRCKHLIRDLMLVAINDGGEIVKTNADLSHMSDAFSYPVEKLLPAGGKRPLGVVSVAY